MFHANITELRAELIRYQVMASMIAISLTGLSSVMGLQEKYFMISGKGREYQAFRRIYDNNVQVGDYVRINNNGHSAIVTEVYSDSFKVIECNLDGDGRHHNCLLRHNWTYSKSSVTYRVHAVNYSLN